LRGNPFGCLSDPYAMDVDGDHVFTLARNRRVSFESSCVLQSSSVQA
jgi:hypothetical protein